MPNNNPNQNNPTQNPNPNKEKSMTLDLMTAKNHIDSFSKAFNRAFLQRKEEILILIIGLIIKKNICVIGLHGEGKSQLVEQFAKNIIKRFYGVQFNRFSTVDETIGHFSIKAMKERDEYIRKIDGKIGDCELAYLDEFFNASGPLMQALQKILNEKRVDLGNGKDKAIPLESAIVSTNFHISKEKSLAPLWDRFLFRIESKPLMKTIKKDEWFKLRRLSNQKKLGQVNHKLDPKIIDYLRIELGNVQIPRSIDDLIFKMIEFCQDEKIELSTRRMIWALDALKAMALLDGRRIVEPSDLHIMKHIIWVHIEQSQKVSKQIDNLMKIVSVVPQLTKIKEGLVAKQSSLQSIFDKLKCDTISDEEYDRLTEQQRTLISIIKTEATNAFEKFKGTAKDCEQSKSILEDIGKFKRPRRTIQH